MDEQTIGRIVELAEQGKYISAVNVLKKLPKNGQKTLCYHALAIIGIAQAATKYGEVRVIKDRKRYEQAKSGRLKDIQPNTVLYEDGRGNLSGLDDMMELIPEDNPLKEYYKQL